MLALQLKAGPNSLGWRPGTAPPVYRPEPLQAVQSKNEPLAAPQLKDGGTLPVQPAAVVHHWPLHANAPVYRPRPPATLQRYTAFVGSDGNNYNVSTNNRYAVRGDNRARLYMSAAAARPTVYRWQWQADGAAVTINAVAFTAYQARQHDGTAVAVPNDCIKTAQIVAGGIEVNRGSRIADLNGFPEPAYPAAAARNAGTIARPGVGSAYLVVHDATAGNFHAATVIAHDGNDSVTMESDAGARTTLDARHIIFDMYNEATAGQSFWARQGSNATDHVTSTSLALAPRRRGRRRRAGGLQGDIESGLSRRQKLRLQSVMT